MKKLSLIIIISFYSVISFSQSNEIDICKSWYNQEKTAEVLIYKSNNKFFGKIVWLKHPNNPNGSEKLDKLNPNPKKKNTKIIGSTMLYDFTFKKNGLYENGKIYDGRSGKTYNCIMTLKDKNTLSIRGYIGISLFGKTQIWTATNNQ